MATGIKFTGNVSYKGKQPFVEREQYATLAEMKAANELSLNEGLRAICLEDKKLYMYNEGNSVDSITGKWREVNFLSKEEKALLTQLANVGDTYATKQEVETAKSEAKQEAIEDAESKYVKKTDEKQVVVETSGLTHTIKFGGSTVGTIDIPKDLFVTNFEYVAGEKKLKITVNNSDGSGSPKVQEVNVADFVQTYTAGTGLEVLGNEFSLTSEYTALPNKVQTLENKVQTLEGKPSYELGFQKTANKYPVAEEGNKLYVEVEVPEVTPASATQAGTMSAEHFKKVESIKNNIFVVNTEDFTEKENAGKLIQDAIYFVKDSVPRGSTPEAFQA